MQNENEFYGFGNLVISLWVNFGKFWKFFNGLCTNPAKYHLMEFFSRFKYCSMACFRYLL